MKKILICAIICFCVPNTFSGYGVANALTGEDIIQIAKEHARRQRIEREKQRKIEEERQRREDYEMKKNTTPALIIGGFFFLGIVFYALITNNKKNGGQNINIYNDRPKD